MTENEDIIVFHKLQDYFSSSNANDAFVNSSYMGGTMYFVVPFNDRDLKFCRCITVTHSYKKNDCGYIFYNGIAYLRRATDIFGLVPKTKTKVIHLHEDGTIDLIDSGRDAFCGFNRKFIENLIEFLKSNIVNK